MKWCDTPDIFDQEDIKRIVQDVQRKCSHEALKRNKLLRKVLRNVRGDSNHETNK